MTTHKLRVKAQLINGFPGGAVVKNLPANEEELKRCGFDPWVWNPGGGNGNPLQYSFLEISMDRRAWWATVNGVAKSWTQLSTTHTQAINRIIKYTHVEFGVGNHSPNLFLGSKITADGDCSHEIKISFLTPWKESYDQPTWHIKKQRHYFANKGPPSQGYGFSSSHVWMWELDYKESWAQKNWCFWIVVLEKTLESPLDCKEIQPVHPKGDQSWVFIGRTDVKAADVAVFWPLDEKSCLIWNDPDVG